MTRLSILIVSYNTRGMTLACLASVYGETVSVPFEVIVVDNASTDGSAAAIAERFPQVRLFASERNLGFAAANNLAAEGAQGKYLLLLNPDTVVQNGAIDRLVAFAQAHPEAGIFGGRTVFGDGRLNPSSVWGMPSVWNNFCRATGLSAVFKRSGWLSSDSYGDWARDTVRDVDIVSGCFLLIRREIWERLGGFDASYFMYGEDWDLCIRARRLGVKCLFCPEAEIVHYGGASERVRADKLVRLLSTKVRLFRSHWPRLEGALLVALLKLWTVRCYATNRLANLVFRRDGSGDDVAWKEVWQRRGEWAGPQV